jgi:hypothetical protein
MLFFLKKRLKVFKSLKPIFCAKELLLRNKGFSIGIKMLLLSFFLFIFTFFYLLKTQSFMLK